MKKGSFIRAHRPPITCHDERFLRTYLQKDQVSEVLSGGKAKVTQAGMNVEVTGEAVSTSTEVVPGSSVLTLDSLYYPGVPEYCELAVLQGAKVYGTAHIYPKMRKSDVNRTHRYMDREGQFTTFWKNGEQYVKSSPNANYGPYEHKVLPVYSQEIKDTQITPSMYLKVSGSLSTGAHSAMIMFELLPGKIDKTEADLNKVKSLTRELATSHLVRTSATLDNPTVKSTLIENITAIVMGKMSQYTSTIDESDVMAEVN